MCVDGEYHSISKFSCKYNFGYEKVSVYIGSMLIKYMTKNCIYVYTIEEKKG